MTPYFPENARVDGVTLTLDWNLSSYLCSLRWVVVEVESETRVERATGFVRRNDDKGKRCKGRDCVCGCPCPPQKYERHNGIVVKEKMDLPTFGTSRDTTLTFLPCDSERWSRVWCSACARECVSGKSSCSVTLVLLFSPTTVDCCVLVTLLFFLHFVKNIFP